MPRYILWHDYAQCFFQWCKGISGSPVKTCVNYFLSQRAKTHLKVLTPRAGAMLDCR